MTDSTEDHEDVLRGEAAPRRAGNASGPDPSNTPIEELVEPLGESESGIDRLSSLWADPHAAEEQVRQSVQRAGQDPEQS